MNYFELFNLPMGFQVDHNKLRTAYMKIQMATHPDKFTQSSEANQEMALEQSAIANKAFSLLNNKENILPYVLELTGHLTPDEKYALSPAFLMEMMELNEAWMEADTPHQKEAVLHNVNKIKNEITEPIKAYLEVDSIEHLTQEAMLQIKEYYYKKKYLDRILEDFHH